MKSTESFTEPFQILGLQPGAQHDEVRRAYRKLAMRWHPDRNQHSRDSEERFKLIKAAYELAIDPAAYRAWQDRQSTAPASTAPEAAPAETVAPIEQTLELSLEEVARGGRRNIRVDRPTPCRTCAGLGRVALANSIACTRCNGVGRLRGKVFSAAEKCPDCHGRGFVRETACTECQGKGSTSTETVFEVQVPVGLRHGETLRLARAGGSILLRIRHLPHPFFSLQGDDLHCPVPVDVLRFVAGGEVEVPTLDGVIRIPLPSASCAAEIRLANKGLPRRHGKGAGDLVLHLQAIFPKNLAPSEAAQLRLFAASLAGRAPELDEWAKRLAQRKGA